MFEPTIILAGAVVVGLMIIAGAMLLGWQGWLELKRSELERGTDLRHEGSPMGATRIEIADLKERIRKLESIASGVEL